MNYSIIKNREELEQFIEWLPELGNSKFYVSLYARKKYNTPTSGTPGLKADKSQLKRFTADKKTLLNKIEKLEVSKGLYTTDNNLIIDESSLALYITPNPRNMHKAALKLIAEITNKISEDFKIDNPQALALNMIQKYGIKKYFDIDVDLTTEGLKADRNVMFNDLNERVSTFLNMEAVTVIQTHGGFHYLVNKDEVKPEFKNKWFMGFTNLKTEFYETTMNDDNQVPVPGCTQGGKYPIMLKK